VLPEEKIQEEVERKKKILVVDDTKLQRLIISDLVTKLGFDVIEAVSGQEAIDRAGDAYPDLILMDIEMPGIDGFEAVRKVRQLATKHYIPVIFVTGFDNEKNLQACIDAGGDDFISKPVNQLALDLKIKSLLRLSDLLKQQRIQKEKFERTQHEIFREQEIAAEIFRKIVHEGSLDTPNIKYLLSPMSLFNGDILLAAYTPTGQLQLMLGDFTGHGLVASIGAGPAAEIFYGMTAKGFGVEEIIPEINKKMCRVLPTGMFLAICLLSFDSQQGLISLFTGGLPEQLLFSKDSGDIARIVSSNLPLGIIDNEQSDFSFEHLEVRADQRLYLFSDGIIEARNKNGKESGIEGLEWCLRNPVIEDSGFDSILESYKRFIGNNAQEDDLTLVEINFDPVLAVREGRQIIQKTKPPAAWQTSMTLDSEALKTTNPVPVVVNQIMELQGLQAYREAIYTIVTELFVNALDHGLLGLDSSLKKDAEGFMHYFELREKRLQEFYDGQIKISFKHKSLASGGQLAILIQDNGSGFDVTAVEKGLDNNEDYSGRGIQLVRKLCSSLAYSDGGRRAKAVFDWENMG